MNSEERKNDLRKKIRLWQGKEAEKKEQEKLLSPEEQKVASLSKKLSLEMYAYEPVYKANYFKETQNKISKLKDYANKAMQMNVRKADINNDIQESAKQLMFDYKNGINKHIHALQEWQKRYANAYLSEKAKYKDPTTEMLQRQDFQTKIDSMNDAELKKYIGSLGEREKLNTFEVNYLLTRIKDDKSTYAVVDDYRRANNIGEEYKNTKEWAEVNNSLSILKTYSHSPLIYQEPNEGETFSRNAVNPMLLSNSLLNGYTDNQTSTFTSQETSRPAINIFANEKQ